MSLSSVVASLAITLSGLSAPVPAPSLPAAVAMAASQPAPIAASDAGGGVTALPDLPPCPNGQGYDELCLLELQAQVIALRTGAIDTYEAGIAAIVAGMEAQIAEAESPAEVAQIILQAQLAIAAQATILAIDNVLIDAFYLANAANCCGPNGLPGGSGVGMDDLGEFPTIICPGGTQPYPWCVAAYEAEFEEYFKAKLAEFYADLANLDPDAAANDDVRLALYQEFIYNTEQKKHDLEVDAILECCDK